VEGVSGDREGGHLSVTDLDSGGVLAGVELRGLPRPAAVTVDPPASAVISIRAASGQSWVPEAARLVRLALDGGRRR
jgi:hypothetical protein